MIENKNRKMKFRAHETFFIRKGWLSKGMKYVQQTKGEVFISKTENPIDVLGLGTNMVKALRYWLQVVDLTMEDLKTRKQSLTDFGKIIFEKDRYLEEIGTLLLLQYKLATNSDKATSWWYFFNYFNQTEFDVNDFVLEISKWIKNENNDEEDVSKKIRSLTDDFNCIVNTYFSKAATTDKSPENNIDCPFVELGLLGTGSKPKTFRKKTPLVEYFNPYITLALILDFSKNELSGKSEIQLNNLLQNENSIGKIFNLDSISLIEILRKVEKIGELKIIRTAGLDVIQITNFREIPDFEKYFAGKFDDFTVLEKIAKFQNDVLNKSDYSDIKTLCVQKDSRREPPAVMTKYICQYYLSMGYSDFWKKDNYIWFLNADDFDIHHIIPLGSDPEYKTKKITIGETTKSLRNKKNNPYNSPLNMLYISKSANKRISNMDYQTYSQTQEVMNVITNLGYLTTFDETTSINTFLEERYKKLFGSLEKRLNFLYDCLKE